jgi:outer membrane lipoprotein carrier protein
MTRVLSAALVGAALAAGLFAGPRPAGAGGAPAEDASVAEPAAPPPSAQDCAERTAALIQARYEGVRDLRARFTQTTRQAGAVSSAPTTARGSVVLAKPGKMRWTYEAPEPSLVISDGVTLWIYDPAFQEAQRLPVSQGYLSGAAIQLLLGEADIFRDFHVAALACGETSAELELVPREPATYEKIAVKVDVATGDLSGTRLVDLLGTVIEVEISELRINQSPPASLFGFEPPQGVRVTDLQP